MNRCDKPKVTAIDEDGRLVERVIGQWKGISARLVIEPDPNERILYYTGRTNFSNEPMFAGPLADPYKDRVVEMRDAKAQWNAGFTLGYYCDGEPFMYRTIGGDWSVDVVQDRFLDRPLTYVNVGTIGHIDYRGPRRQVLSPLQQAIRDVNNGKG